MPGFSTVQTPEMLRTMEINRFGYIGKESNIRDLGTGQRLADSAIVVEDKILA